MMVSDNEVAALAAIKLGGNTVEIRPKDGFRRVFLHKKLNKKETIIMATKKIPTKIYLSEDELPKYWYNLRADMKEQHEPFLNPATLKPCTAEELNRVFCKELVAQELNQTDRFIEIPEGIREFYKAYRPSSLTRAYF